MQEKIKELIQKYQIEQKQYHSMVEGYENRGLENLDSEEIEYYGAYLGKWEKLSEVIIDLQNIIK